MKSYCAVIHGGTRVDLNEPGIVILIHHKIVSKKLMSVVPVFDQFLSRFTCVLADLLHIRPDFLEEHVFTRDFLLGSGNDNNDSP